LVIGQRLRPVTPAEDHESLEALRELVESGAVTPVIDRTYPLVETADAIRYLEQGHAAGKIVIQVQA
jgi:NADPH:quinone reductase-like Zn-dependent oxidoreductase